MSAKKHSVQAVKKKTHVQLKLEKYIRDIHIAEEISKTKYPYLIAAIAKIESEYRPQIKGDNGESWGMYQIQPKHWGWYGDSIQDQTRLCQDIIEKMGIHKHKKYSVYNGKGKKARLYAQKVIKIMKEIENC